MTEQKKGTTSIRETGEEENLMEVGGREVRGQSVKSHSPVETVVLASKPTCKHGTNTSRQNYSQTTWVLGRGGGVVEAVEDF